jgi:undecaprenyl diphosphate synthase
MNEIPNQNLPQHIAIIMDGNGRWAQERGLPRSIGHKKGVDSLRDIVRKSGEIGIKYLTVYTFSTENWCRPEGEVNFLMLLLEETIQREISSLCENNVRLRFLGRKEQLPQALQKKIEEAENLTEKNSGLNLNIMLNYGGRAEIVDAVRAIAKDWKNGRSLSEINEKVISSYLYTQEIPDPDILIRTAGETRISNFLLWQTAYTEFWTTTIFWPDFSPNHLLECIEDYQKLRRKFGGL